MSIILFILIGAIVGWIASAVTYSAGSKSSLTTDLILGVVGSLIGAIILYFFGREGIGGFNFYSLIVAIFSAVILIVLARAFQKVPPDRRKKTRS